MRGKLALGFVLTILLTCACTHPASTVPSMQLNDESPIATATPTPDECLSGSCYQSELKDCAAVEKAFKMGQYIDMNTQISVTGKEGDVCVVHEKILSDNTGYGFSGKEMTCRIPLDLLAKQATGKITDYCTGTLADAIAKVAQ